MDIQKLKDFLVEAKTNTYASTGEGGEKTLSDGGKKLTFEKDVFRYVDKYFGSESFIGEEVVFYEDKPVWGMNYRGGIITRTDLNKRIYSFLQESLRRVPANKPFRGPASFKHGNFKYLNQSSGDIQRFAGKEHILHRNKKVYKLDYHGGIISRSQ